MLKQYGQGHIIVMAESVDEARSIFSKKLEENIFQDDEEIEEGIKHIRTTFMNEISQFPTVLDETYLIMGSA